MPYLSESFEGGMRASMDGNNYLAWTSKTNAGIDCRMGFNLEASIFLPLIELWKSNIYNLVDKNLFDMPKKIELVSPENGKKMNTGESVDVSFFVTSLNNITGNYFPCTGGLVNFVTNGETDKTVAISDLNGRVTVKWKPTAKGNVLAAKIVDKDGETISEATFTPVVEEKDYTVNVIVENSEYCSGKVDIVSISSGFIENENGMLLASVSYNSDRFSFDLPTNVSDQYLVGMGEIAPGMTVSDPRVKVLPIYLYAYKLDPETKQLMITGEFYHGYYRDKSNFCKGNLIYADRNVRVTGSIINESKYHTTKFSLNLQKGWNIMYGTRTLKEDGWEEDEISAQAPAIARWYFDRDYLRNGLIYYD
jgi:uncharacterized protein YkuJ